MRNRAPRCVHGFYDPLCVVVDCEHFDGATPAPPPNPASRKPAYRGATEAVRAVLLETPQLSNIEVASLCRCSKTLVSQARVKLGLRKRRVPPC